MAASSAFAAAPARAAKPGRFHRPELDVLRFGAFFLVFLHHALPHAASEYPRWGTILAAIGRAGALGVDLFFTLSAFLITELLLRERRATGSIDIRAFYARRVLRIWPLYFFALLVLAPLIDGMPSGHLTAFLLLGGNWACAWWGYPASAFALLWSVSIEEQFYLAWPWIARWRGNLGLVLLAMLATAWVTRLWLAIAGSAHPAVWCNTLARLDPIALGAMLAWLLRSRPPGAPARIRVKLIGGGAFALLAAGAPGEHAGWHALWTYPLAAFACVLILYGVLCSQLRSPVLEYLGKISFGLYVFHAAALHLVPFAPAALLLTIAAAAVSYRFLESPFLRWKQRLARVGSRPV
jgi:peptidoglycan/LPS O-acetylase OafA/YrhL